MQREMRDEERIEITPKGSMAGTEVTSPSYLHILVIKYVVNQDQVNSATTTLKSSLFWV